MDDADRADKLITETVSDGIQAARRTLANNLTACGVCHWCESPVQAGRVFCSTECSGDYEHDRLRKRDLGL